MTQQYSIEEAKEDYEAASRHCRYGDPSLAIAFAEIVNRLLAGLSTSDFASQCQIMAFVFTGLYRLRELLYNIYHPSSIDKEARWILGDFGSGLRARLSVCNSGSDSHHPGKINPLALWDYYHKEFLPVVEVLRSSGDAKTDLSFLSFY